MKYILILLLIINTSFLPDKNKYYVGGCIIILKEGNNTVYYSYTDFIKAENLKNAVLTFKSAINSDKKVNKGEILKGTFSVYQATDEIAVYLKK